MQVWITGFKIYFFKLIGFISVILLFSGCRKKEFPVNNQLPDANDLYYVKGKFNGIYTEIVMNSPKYELEMSCTKDSLSVYEYQSGLLPASCTDCYHVRFYFRDMSPVGPASAGGFSVIMVPQSSFSFWNMDNIHTSDTSYVLTFSGSSSRTNVNYNYVFGDGSISYAPTTSHPYTSSKKYPVRLYVYDPVVKDQAVIENPIDINNFKKGFYYYVQLDSVKQSTGLAFFSAKSIFSPPVSYAQFFWNFGNGFILGGNIAVINYQPGQKKDIELMVIKNSDTSIARYQLALPQGSTVSSVPLTANFHVSSYLENIQNGLNLFLKSCNILIKKPSGRVYQSKYAGNSNKDFNAEILDVNDAASPNPEFKAKKVKFKFNANLVCETDAKDTLKLRDAEAKLLFIYK
jgi:hypothetical protein